MRVLVTGDRGYIGVLMAAGHDIVGLDAGWFDGCDFGTARDGYEQTTGDIRDAIADDLAGVDAVVYLAAISNDPVGQLSALATYSVNADGAFHRARVAKQARMRRFLLSSSCSLYRAAGNAAVAEEEEFHPVAPCDAAQRGLTARICACSSGSRNCLSIPPFHSMTTQGLHS